MRLSPSDCDWSISMNFAVPDRAIVPRDETRSSRVMPMPVSSMTSVLDAGSPLICIFISPFAAMTSGLDTDVNRSLSSASDALDTSSRRKTSLLLYRELTMRSRRRLTSAWYSYVSPLAGFSSVAASARTIVRGLTRARRLAASFECANGFDARRARAAREGAAARAVIAEVIAAADIVVVADGWIVSCGGSCRARRLACRARSKDADATKKSGGGDKKAPEVEGRGRSLKDRFDPNCSAVRFGGRNVK